MATKQELIDDPNSVWNKSAPDEPLFILCARDLIASGKVREWAGTARASGVNDAKVASAMEVADAMEQWPVRRFPD